MSPGWLARSPRCGASAGATPAPRASNDCCSRRSPGMALFTLGSADCSLAGAASGVRTSSKGVWQAASVAIAITIKTSRNAPQAAQQLIGAPGERPVGGAATSAFRATEPPAPNAAWAAPLWAGRGRPLAAGLVSDAAEPQPAAQDLHRSSA